jgi:hypothetical protein
MMISGFTTVQAPIGFYSKKLSVDENIPMGEESLFDIHKKGFNFHSYGYPTLDPR